MADYETPTITELGSVADFTHGDWNAPGSDNLTFLNEIIADLGFEGGFGGAS